MENQILNKHVQLTALKTMWNLPEETLNKILWANTPTTNELKENSIGLASEYIDFMDGIVETKNPAEAWEQWCIIHDIEHEIVNNPYLN